jgi:hypothetical protein
MIAALFTLGLSLSTPPPPALSTQFIQSANYIIHAPLQTAVHVDPCAGRHWSLGRPFTFCGPVRLVPADPIERDLWYGEHIAEAIDAARSFEGQRALFESHQIVVQRLEQNVVAIDGGFLTSATPVRMWGPVTSLNGGYYASPAQAEGDPLMRPFARGGVAGYMLGFFALDVGESMLERATTSLGLRGLTEATRRSIIVANTYGHIKGAQSWTPILSGAHALSSLYSFCNSLAQRDSIGSPPPPQCMPMWPAHFSYGITSVTSSP